MLERAAVLAERQGIAVLRARGDDLEALLPWGLTRQLFADFDPDDLSGSAGLARPVFALAGGAQGPEPPSDGFPLLHGLHAILADLAAARPLLLVLDDVQWSDPQTIRFVAYLLNRAESLAVALVLGLRSGGYTAPEVADLVPRIAASRYTTVHRLVELSADGVTALVWSAHPDAGADFCVGLHRATAGNPFLCREMLSAVRNEGIRLDEAGAAHLVTVQHAGIRRSILVRLAQLGRDASMVAAAAAVAGAAGTAARLAGLTGLDAARTAAAVDSLVAAEILCVVASGIEFVHPIIREAVYADIGPARRAALHAVTARRLRDEHGNAVDVASHLMAAGVTADDAWGVPFLRRAATAALGQGAPERACALLEAALAADQPGGDPRILVELGRAEAAAGRAAATSRYGLALEYLGATAADAVVACEIGEALYTAGDFGAAFEAFLRGLGVLPPASEDDDILEARLVAGVVLAGTMAVVGAERVAAVLAERIGGEAPPGRLAHRALLAVEAGRDAFGLGVPPALHRHAGVVAKSMAALDGPSLPLGLGVVAFELLTLSLYITRQLDTAQRELDRVIAAANENGELPSFASMLVVRSLVRLQAGCLDAAVEDCREQLRVSAEFPSMNVQAEAAARHVLVEAALLTGDRAAASDAIDVPDAEQRWGGSIMYAWFLHAVGQVELARGDAEAARAAFLDSGARFLAPGGTGGHTAWRAGAAEAAYVLGDRDHALALVDEEVRVARDFGTPTRVADAIRARARFLPAEDAVEALTEAASLIDPSARLSRARVELELGSALRRTGRRREAREHLRNALAVARACGAVTLAERAVAELGTAGARRSTRAVTGVGALTPAERRVADLAAEGMSNREIAAELCVTRKTVEVHLSACYRKLGIGGRSELAALLMGARRT